jgi:hypothetical protein
MHLYVTIGSLIWKLVMIRTFHRQHQHQLWMDCPFIDQISRWTVPLIYQISVPVDWELVEHVVSELDVELDLYMSKKFVCWAK